MRSGRPPRPRAPLLLFLLLLLLLLAAPPVRSAGAPWSLRGANPSVLRDDDVRLDFVFSVNDDVFTANLFGGIYFSYYFVTPHLPEGFMVLNGSLVGLSESVLFKTRFLLEGVSPLGHSMIDFFLTVIETPSYCTFGFMTLYWSPYNMLDATPQCNTPIYYWTVSSNLPDALSFNRETGRIFGWISNLDKLPVQLELEAFNRLGSHPLYLTIDRNGDSQDYGVSFCFAESMGCRAYWSFTTLQFTTCDFDYAINFELASPLSSSTMLVNSFLSIPAAGVYQFYLECTGGCVMYLDSLSDPLLEKTDCTSTKSEPVSVHLEAQQFPVRLYSTSENGRHHLKLFWMVNGSWVIVGSNYFQPYRSPPWFFVYATSILELEPSESFSLQAHMLGYANIFRLMSYHPYVKLSEVNGELSGYLGFNTSIAMKVIAYNWDGYDYTEVILRSVSEKRYLPGTHLEVFFALETQCDGNPFEAGRVGEDNLAGRHQLSSVALGYAPDASSLPSWWCGGCDPSWSERRGDEEDEEEDGWSSFEGYPLSPDSFEDQLFTFRFDGSLNLSESGNYSFLLFLRGAGSLRFLNSTWNRLDCYANNTIEVSSVLSAGVYDYHIEYGSYYSAPMLRLYWVPPGGGGCGRMSSPCALSLVPLSVFVTSHPSYFSYQSTLVTYVFNQTVVPNGPLRAFPNRTHFSIYPRLPEGLSINSVTGFVSGTPRVVYYPLTPHTVRAAVNDSFSVRSTITMWVVPGRPPRSITSWRGTEPSCVLSSSVGQEVVPLSFQYSGLSSAVTFSPPLPRGLSFDETEQCIVGTPMEPASGNTTMYFRSPFGVSIYTIEMRIDQDPALESYHLEISNPYNAQVDLVVLDGEEVIRKSSFTRNWIRYDEMHQRHALLLRVLPESGKVIFYKLYVGVDSLVAYGYLDEPADIPFVNSLDEPIKLWYSGNNLLMFHEDSYNQEIAMWTGPVSRFSLIGCPPEMSIDPIYGILSGTLKGYVSCTVHAENPLYSKNVTVVVNVVACNTASSHLLMTTLTKLRSDGITMLVYPQSEVRILLMFSGLQRSEERLYPLCLATDFSLLMLETESGAWRGSGFTLTFDGVPAVTYYGDHLLDRVMDVVNVELRPLIDAHSLFFCYFWDESNLDPDWFAPGFDSSSWSCIQGSLPQVTSARLFVLVHLDVGSGLLSRPFFSLFLSALSDASIDVFLDGRLVVSGVTPSVSSSGTKARPLFALNGLVRDSFQKSESVLGLRFSSVSAQSRSWYVNFDVGLRAMDASLELTRPGMVTFDNRDGTSPRPSNVDSLVDFDETTVFISFHHRSSTPRVLFNVTKVGFSTTTVTLYSITNGISGRLVDPAKWLVYGVLLNETRSLIDARENELFSGQQTRYFPLSVSGAQFTGFIIEFLEYGDISRNTRSDRMELAEIHFYLQEVSYCAGSGIYTPTLAGSEWTHNCGIGYEGVLTRSCKSWSEWGPSPVFSEHCRLIAPENMEYPMPFSDLICNLPLNQVHAFLPRIGGARLWFSVFPGILPPFFPLEELPGDLELDPSTGEIRGTPRHELLETSFLISAFNILGSTNTTIFLSVKKVYCPPTGAYPLTELFETASVQCQGRSGTKERTCTYTDGKVTWGEERDGCGESPSSSLIMIMIVSLTVVSVILVPVLIFVFKRLTRDRAAAVAERNEDLDGHEFYRKLISFR